MLNVLPRALVLGSLIIGASIIIGTGSASADEWGAWKWSGGSACNFAGTNIITTDSPNLHNLGDANSCVSNYDVQAIEYHFDSGGRTIDSCNTGYSTNYNQCSIQASTLSGDYWEWAGNLKISGTIYDLGCDNQYEGYYYCWHTDDPVTS